MNNNFAIVIPARERNEYSELGDLAPFGDISLLEWKLSQAKSLLSKEQIYVTTDSKKIAEIASDIGVNVIKRTDSLPFEDVIVLAASEVKEDFILWANVTSPFLGKKELANCISVFSNSETGVDSVVTVSVKREYTYFKGDSLNFDTNKFIARKNLQPVHIATNGCYLITKETVLNNKTLFGNKPFLLEVDGLAEIEIKNILDFNIAKDLISMYFLQNEV